MTCLLTSPLSKTQTKNCLTYLGIMQKQIFPSLSMLSFLYWKESNFLSWFIILLCTQNTCHECSNLKNVKMCKQFTCRAVSAEPLGLFCLPATTRVFTSKDSYFLSTLCKGLLDPLGVREINLNLQSLGKKGLKVLKWRVQTRIRPCSLDCTVL